MDGDAHAATSARGQRPLRPVALRAPLLGQRAGGQFDTVTLPPSACPGADWQQNGLENMHIARAREAARYRPNGHAHRSRRVGCRARPLQDACQTTSTDLPAMSLAHSSHLLARRLPRAQLLLPSPGQRRCYRWGARAPAQPLRASAALRHHIPTSRTTLHQPVAPAAPAARCAPGPATSAGRLDSRPAAWIAACDTPQWTEASHLSCGSRRAAAASSQQRRTAGGGGAGGAAHRAWQQLQEQQGDAAALAESQVSGCNVISWICLAPAALLHVPLTQWPSAGCRPNVVEEVARELRALMGDGCSWVTQAQMEHTLKKIPSVLTLPAATLAQRIFLLAAKLEREPGELLRRYIGQPQVLTSTTDALLGRVDELLAWAGPDNRQLVLRAACINPAMLQRCAFVLVLQAESRGHPACLDKLHCCADMQTMLGGDFHMHAGPPISSRHGWGSCSSCVAWTSRRPSRGSCTSTRA
jgi:hypothetical protein